MYTVSVGTGPQTKRKEKKKTIVPNHTPVVLPLFHLSPMCKTFFTHSILSNSFLSGPG